MDDKEKIKEKIKEKGVVIVLFILLAVWFINVKVNAPKRPPEPPVKPKESPEKVEPDPGADTGKTKVAVPETPDTLPPVAEAPVKPLAEFAGLEPAKPVTLIIDELGELEIDPEKGGITRIQLAKYRNGKRDGPMLLGHPDYPMLSLQDADGKLKFSHAKVLEQSPTQLKIARQLLGTETVLEQSWAVVNAGSYDLQYSLRLRSPAKDRARLEKLKLKINAGFMAPLGMPMGFFKAAGIDQRIQFMGKGKSGSSFKTMQAVHKFKPEKIEAMAATELDWLAIQNKFFVAVLSGKAPFAGSVYATPPVDKAKDDKKAPRCLIGYLYLPATSAADGKALDFDFYLGPKNYNKLKALGGHKEQIMQFDRFIFMRLKLMEWIARLIYWLITSLFSLVGNYGLAIIGTTLVIRGLFWPITHRTTIWSQRMKELQPLMAELKEKYQSDPQMMHRKTMELYREHKINPFGGCLPLFFQLPVFFALFNVLRSSIELRHASFLWVGDLSLPDRIFAIPGINLPVHPLALMMGGAMALQQKLMPTSADPMQRKMMIFMSVFIVVICYSMPSGLTLYWTVSNIFSIIQFKIIHSRLEKAKNLKTPETAKT